MAVAARGLYVVRPTLRMGTAMHLRHSGSLPQLAIAPCLYARSTLLWGSRSTSHASLASNNATRCRTDQSLVRRLSTGPNPFDEDEKVRGLFPTATVGERDLGGGAKVYTLEHTDFPDPFVTVGFMQREVRGLRARGLRARGSRGSCVCLASGSCTQLYGVHERGSSSRQR